jgi:hypothetical protein
VDERRAGVPLLDRKWIELSEAKREIYSPLIDDGRKHGSKMILSRHGVRMGLDTTPTRRLTPPNAVRVEDFLDGMSFIDAIRYDHPASPSAMAILAIQFKRGREEPFRYGRSRGVKAQRKADEARAQRKEEQRTKNRKSGD